MKTTHNKFIFNSFWFQRIRLTKLFLIFLCALCPLWLISCQTISSQGVKNANQSPTPQVEQYSNRPKIVAFGDSLTAGFGLPEKESYPYLLQQKLNAEGYEYEVVNAGISGDTSSGGLDRIDWSLKQPNVQILILELGANDILRGLPIKQMKENLREIIRKAKAKKVTVLFCGMLAPPNSGNQYVNELNKAFTDLVKEEKVAFMPFFLENVGGIAKLNQADGIHPNTEGTKIVAENVFKALKPLLKGKN